MHQESIRFRQIQIIPVQMNWYWLSSRGRCNCSQSCQISLHSEFFVHMSAHVIRLCGGVFGSRRECLCACCSWRPTPWWKSGWTTKWSRSFRMWLRQVTPPFSLPPGTWTTLAMDRTGRSTTKSSRSVSTVGLPHDNFCFHRCVVEYTGIPNYPACSAFISHQGWMRGEVL